MRLIGIDTSQRSNVKVTFDEPVKTLSAVEYVAGVYREVSGDKSVKVNRPCDWVRDSDGRYEIKDGTLRQGLFVMGDLVDDLANPKQTDVHYIHQHHAKDEERELLITGLEAQCPA
ncbi:MAG: hypothetical protein KKF56_03095 [Nanoarchaeota archaeon]|nr:hypothetical protein [Nanoarchaeota archaeon]